LIIELNERISFKIIVLRKPKVASKRGRKKNKNKRISYKLMIGGVQIKLFGNHTFLSVEYIKGKKYYNRLIPIILLSLRIISRRKLILIVFSY
jgi:hypothetical protein